MRQGCLDCLKTVEKPSRGSFLFPLIFSSVTFFVLLYSIKNSSPISEWETNQKVVLIIFSVCALFSAVVGLVYLKLYFKNRTYYTFFDADNHDHLHRDPPTKTGYFNTETIDWSWHPKLDICLTHKQPTNLSILSPTIMITVSGNSVRTIILNPETKSPHTNQTYAGWDLKISSVISHSPHFMVRIDDRITPRQLFLDLPDTLSVMMRFPLQEHIFNILTDPIVFNPNWNIHIAAAKDRIVTCKTEHDEHLRRLYADLQALVDFMYSTRKPRGAKSTELSRIVLERFLLDHFPDDIRSTPNPEMLLQAQRKVQEILNPTTVATPIPETDFDTPEPTAP
ncbi:TPA: hypothetical protein DF272_00385 [Candidatus Falkowbacteria bacterium]|nr:hypothetical protein [Candidatus Falkowbacteria bacterium]